MIRQFQLRDLPLIHRLGEVGIPLDAESAAIGYPHPVRSALVNRIMGRHYPTYIWKSDDQANSAFVQFRCDEGCSTARLLFLGTSDALKNQEDDQEIDEDLWLPLMDDLASISGSRGIHNLIAEVNESGPELPILRKAGFVVYTRQDIWINDSTEDYEKVMNLRPYDSIDDWDVFVLYSNVVPRLIQSVEPNPPLNTGDNWVLREDDELTAFIHANRGTVATWMRLLIHPNAHTKPRMIVKAALGTSEATEEHPIYCCVRKYQSWLQRPLEDVGFRYWGSQAVMVRHLTKAIKMQSQVKNLGFEAQAVQGSSTIIQGFSQSNGRHRRKHTSDL